MEEDNDLTEKLVQQPEDDLEHLEPLQVPAEELDDEGSDDEPDADQSWTRGEKQPNQCRDAPFAILWYAQMVAILLVALKYGMPALGDYDENSSTSVDYSGVLYLSLIAGGASFGLSGVTVALMTTCAKSLVQMSLIFSIFMSLVIAVIAILESNALGAVFGFIVFLVTCCYAYAVYERIPFAAANLNTALVAIKTNFGVSFIAYLLSALSVLWCGVWTLALIGVYDKTKECGDDGCKEEDLAGGYHFLLLIALFWTQQVVQNVIHVTIAGVVGTWWFDPSDASSCCSRAIKDSFFRATTTSFGSICFGSLLVAIVQALRQIVVNARRQEEGDSLLLCVAECLLACLESLMEYFNRWAYIYVGLYGYCYLEAGKNVMTLFQQRGWTTIITDDLVSNTLSLMCLVLSGLSGCVGLLINSLHGSWLEEFGENAAIGAFFVSFVIGLVTSSIMVSTIDSAVNTVIVCFAEAPAEFQANHPQLSNEMRAAWRQAWPVECEGM